VDETALIAIVDDDNLVRRSLARLIKSLGLRVEAFASAEDFLHCGHLHDTRCLILDVRMPGMDGLELQWELAATQSRIPIIYITGHGDEAVKAQALQAGALAFLRKPFSEETLLKSIYLALHSVQRNHPDAT
jgi:FixJ family two-component response regulator